MKLFILGLIILLILVCQIYKIIQEKNPIENPKENPKEKESLTKYQENNEHRGEFIDDTIDYYDKLIDNKGFKLDEELGDNKNDDFVYLDGRNRLVKNGSNVINIKEGFHGDNRVPTVNEIEKCRAIKECGMLDKEGYDKCGYCGKLGDKVGGGSGEGYNQDGKFEYRPDAIGGEEIGPDVCPSDALEEHIPMNARPRKKRPLGNRWATNTAECKQIQLQDKCSSIKNCNEMTGELDEICGWCPSEKAYPKDDSNQILYPENDDLKKGNTQIKGDRCDVLYKTRIDKDGNNVPFYTELTSVADCNICDASGMQIIEEDANGNETSRWHPECLQGLWGGEMKSGDDDNVKLKVKCTTAYDASPESNAGGSYGRNYGNISIGNDGIKRDQPRKWNEWYEVQEDMRQKVIRPLYNFSKDYNTKNTEGEELWKDPEDMMEVRRSYIMNEEKFNSAEDMNKTLLASKWDKNSQRHVSDNMWVDQLWKKCFNKTNKDNEIKCVPNQKIFNNSKNEVRETVHPNYEDLENWEIKCNLLNNNKCENKDKYNGNGGGGSFPDQYDNMYNGYQNKLMCKNS